MGNQREAEIRVEQDCVDRAYAQLDSQRKKYRAEQRKVEATGAWGTPQARTERDVTAAHYGDRAARLERVEDRLVFGRLDTTDGGVMHVGRTGLKQNDGKRILTDWRAPAAMPFYRATSGDPLGVVRRRHISTRMREVRGLEDEMLDSVEESSELKFQGEGALMASLGSARDGHMSDIVATIQAEQDKVVRAPAKGIVVVQGGPGTGKTAVALHRAAYLLYSERDRLERSGALIVGPTRDFLRYIEQVLPSLGETGVVSVTMGDLLPNTSTSLADSPEITAAKGSLGWIKTLKEAVRSLERVPREPIKIRVGAKTCTLTPETILNARTRARRSSKPHNEAREAFATELLDDLVSQLSESDRDPDTMSWWRERVRDSPEARRAINLAWMPTRPITLLERLYAKPEFLARVGSNLSETERGLVNRPKGAPLTIADIPLLDELEELLGHSPLFEKASTRANQLRQEEIERAEAAIIGQNLGGGIVNAEMLAERARGEEDWKPLSERAREDRGWAYGHIVVDEGQDLSPMMWHSLLRRCPSRSFTVVGDLDQARGQTRPKSWSEALGPAGSGLSQQNILTVSYRTPKTITDLAADVQAAIGQPVHFPVTAARDLPHAIETTKHPANELSNGVYSALTEERKILDEALGEGEGSIAIIVPPRLKQDFVDAAAPRVSVIVPSDAKGLEYDTTILVEPSEILQSGPGDLFVAMTRSTRRLRTIHTTDLPAGWTKPQQSGASLAESGQTEKY